MNKGFTLIEVCVVIVILSLIMVPLYRYIFHQKENERQRIEDVTEERVLSSLSLFYKEAGRYPCPADPSENIGSADFGTEDCTLGTGVLSGDLPIRALGLPPKTAANVYGWKHTYAVTEGLTTPPPITAGAITVNDNSGTALVNNAAFVIVNHGRNGAGSSTLAGGTAGPACPAAPARENENCNGDAIFQEHQVSTDSGNNYYDDTVLFSMVRGENSQWIPSGVTGGRLNVVNRNTGNVGIGAGAPADRLHIQGGNLRVQSDGVGGGNVQVDLDITATGTVRADQDVTAGNRVESPSFFYVTP